MAIITEEINIKLGCDVENPIYLRWVNQHGMIDQYLFGVNQLYTVNTKDGDLVRLNFDDYETQEALTEILSKESVREIKIQAFDVDRQTINALTDLKESKKIQMLTNTSIISPTWQDVKIKGGSTEMYNTKNLIFNWEATIQLPERLIQSY